MLLNIQTGLHTLYATINMRQLQTIINYARSAAILHKSQVFVCPSGDKRHCLGSDWSQGILVLAPNFEATYFRLKVPAGCRLQLNQSGFNNKKLTIEPNGLTNHNGGWNYSAPNHNIGAQFKLYFNKALRIYILKDKV